MKYFKNFKLSYYLRVLLISLIYPVFSMLKSPRKILALSDSCLILALVLLIIGILYNLYQKGHFDNHSFLLMHGLKNDVSYEDFSRAQNKKREDSFNYPLLCALTLLAISLITSLFV